VFVLSSSLHHTAALGAVEDSSDDTDKAFIASTLRSDISSDAQLQVWTLSLTTASPVAIVNDSDTITRNISDSELTTTEAPLSVTDRQHRTGRIIELFCCRFLFMQKSRVTVLTNIISMYRSIYYFTNFNCYCIMYSA